MPNSPVSWSRGTSADRETAVAKALSARDFDPSPVPDPSRLWDRLAQHQSRAWSRRGRPVQSEAIGVASSRPRSNCWSS